MSEWCSKRRYGTYGEGLEALTELEERTGQPVIGSVYTCSKCGSFHISKRRFTVDKKRGRGKSRRGVLEDIG